MSAAAEFPWTSQDPKAELRVLFENAPLGLVQCQRQGNATALNPALERMLGGPPKTAGVLRFADLVQPQDRAQSERLLRELFEGERESFQIDSKPRAGPDRPLRWTAWRVSGANGAPDYALALAADAPPDRELEQRLRQAERLEAVGRLAGGVAHDFNNLLTGVLLYCDLLVTVLEPGHRARKYAEEIRSAGMQASGLVRQLMAVARPAGNESRLLSLNEIAEGMRNLLVRLIGENISLNLHLDSSLGLIKMDPTQAQQVLLNLVLNARDAMPGGGQISVETSNCKVQVLTEGRSGQTGDVNLPCALFVVADNGGGMDAATRAHLFEAFFTTKSAGKGTGLGLATVHDIVTANGGLIHVDSAPGSGTRVSVLLPLVPEATLHSKFESGSQPASNEGVLLPRDLPREEELP
jgi:two-component system, cell cycle sensor histidine kinase and response regulator CckA